MRSPVLILALAAAIMVISLLPAPVQSPASSAATGLVTVYVYLPRGGPGRGCDRVLPVRRLVARPRLLTGALRALLAGPTATERRRGYGGWFSARTAGHLRSVNLVGGVAYVDFRTFSQLIPNASSSCGSSLLLAQLERTARQFPTVKRTVYSFAGSSRAFYEWLGREAPPGRSSAP